MASIEIYNPDKVTGYVVDEYIRYDMSVFRCKENTPKPAGAFDNAYWNLIGYALDGTGIMKYSSENTELSFEDEEKFIETEVDQTIDSTKVFTKTPIVNTTTEDAFYIKNHNVATNTRAPESTTARNISFIAEDGSNLGKIYLQKRASSNDSVYYFRSWNPDGVNYTDFTLYNGGGGNRYFELPESPAGTNSTTDLKAATIGWVNNPALSQNVMHKDAENIIKRNNSIQYNNPYISTATNPTSNDYGAPIYFNDMYGNRTGYLRNGKLTNGNQFVGLQAYRKIGTTEYYSSLDIGTTSDGTAFCNWQGNQIATTNNVVDLSSSQTITGTKTFNDGKLYAKNPHLVKHNTSLEGGEIYFDGADSEPNSTKSMSIDRYNGTMRFIGSASTDTRSSVLLNLDFQNKKTTINAPLTVTGALGASDFDIIKGSDTNGKGDSRFLGYYTGNQIYARISAYNKTSSKNMYLDVISKDDGNGVVSLGGGTTNLNMTTATAATNLAYVATMGWTNDPTKSTNVVHRTGTETISGVKSFNDAIRGRFRTIAASQGSDNTNCWFKLGEIKLSGIWNSKHVIFKMFDGSSGGTSLDGTITGKIMTRIEGTAGTLNTNNSHITFDMDSSWIDLNNFKLLYKNNQGTSDAYYVQVEFWVKTPAAYRHIMFEIDNEYTGNASYERSWTWYDKPTGVSSLPSGYTQINALISPNRIASVKNQNTASGTTTNVYDWEGTLAQYNAQNIATTHPEWLCFITDDHTATAYSAYSKTESDSRYVKTADIDNKWKTLLSTLYPKGSIYIGTQTTCPLATLISGSTWVLVSKGCSLWGGNGQMYDSSTPGSTSQSNYANAQANTTIAAGLPNITGEFDGIVRLEAYQATTPPMTGTGALTNAGVSTATSHVTSSQGSNRSVYKLGVDASRSNPIYSKSTTVQPPAYVVNVWRRTA